MTDDAVASSASAEADIPLDMTDPPTDEATARAWDRPTSSDGQTFTGFTSLTISMISLGCVLVGYLSGDDVVPLLIISGAGLLITSAWYARTKLFRLSLFFGAFGGFIYTYVLVQLGITNRWYGIPIQHLTHLVSTYFSIWFVIFVIVAVAMRFMSSLLTAALLVTDLGVALILLANIRGSVDLLSVAAVPFFIVPLLCIYYLSTTTLKDRRKGARKDKSGGGPSRSMFRASSAASVPDPEPASDLAGSHAGAVPAGPNSVATAIVRPLGNRLARVGIVALILVGLLLVPISLVPSIAKGMSGVLADVGVTSSRSALSAFIGDLPVGLPSEASVSVDGAFTGVPAIPRVTQADPVALDLIGYGPVQMTAPALQAITQDQSSIGALADPSTIASSDINPVIRSLFATRPTGGSDLSTGTGTSSATVGGTDAPAVDDHAVKAYIATSAAPTDGMSMICPAGHRVDVGGGTIDTPGAMLVATTATDASGASPVAPKFARGWSITFSDTGMVTLWVICRS